MTAPSTEPAAIAGNTTAWPLLLLVSVGALLSAMTSSVINVALPDIAREFAVDPSSASWFVLSFLLAVTVLLLPAGRLGDIAGHGRMYLWGSVVFGLGGLACGFAPSASALIVARVAQGLGSAMVMSTSPALLTQSVPPGRRGFALGFMSTALYVGLTIGPPVGGMMVRQLGWRSIFHLMFAGALVVVVACLFLIPKRPASSMRPRFDYLGALLIAAGTLSFLLVCTKGPAWGIRHPATIGLAALSVVLLPVFVRTQLAMREPTVDLRLFRSMVFSSAAVGAMLNYASLFIVTYMLPFALRDGQGMAPHVLGRVLSAQAAGMALLAWASGWISDRIGGRWLGVLGMVVTALGMAGLAASWPTSGPTEPSVWMLLLGAGTGLFISPNSSALMGAAPRHRQGIAGGVMALARNLGMSLGVAIASALFATVFEHGKAVTAWSSRADAVVRIGLAVAASASLTVAGVSFVGQSPRFARRAEPGP